MTRSIHRRSTAMRLFSAYVVLVVLVSFVGFGYAAPGSNTPNTLMTNERAASGQQPEAEETPPAEEPVEEPAEDAPEAPDEDVPAPEDDSSTPEDKGEVPEGDVPASETEPAPEETTSEDAAAEEAVSSAKASPLDEELAEADSAEAVEPVTDPTDATAQGVVPTYLEGNPVCEDNLGFKIDGAPENKTYTGLPGGATITITNATNEKFDFSASGIVVHGVIVKASSGAYHYSYLPDGISADQGLYSVQTNKGGFFGLSHVIFCYTQAPSTGKIVVRKYYDDDGSGYHEGGEEWLDGFSFKLERGESDTGPWTEIGTQMTEGPNGWTTFDNQIAGWYQLTEVLTPAQIVAGWTCTRAPVRVFYHTGEENGQVADEEFDQENKWFGNVIKTHEKKFKLVYEGTVPANTTFWVTYKVNGLEQRTDFTGTTSPFTETEDLPHNALITDVYWHATWTPENGSPVDIVLGMTADDDPLTGDYTNEFKYGGWLNGYKYEDMNADGSKAGDDGLEGWKIYMLRKVDGDWVPFASDVTDEHGYYAISGILPGTYRVYEDIDAQTEFDWTCSSPALGYHELRFGPIGMPSSASVACEGTKHYDKHFMNWAPASISGMKFEDLDKDGVHDSNEEGLANWVIFVDYNNDGALNSHPDFGDEPSAMTDEFGNYEITGVHPGTFNVLEVNLPGSGWFQSYPSAGSYEVTFESRGVYGLDIEDDYDFGNWTWASKAGMKFEDMNANGIYDEGDKPLGGIRVYVEIDGVPGFSAGDLSDITSFADGSYFIDDVPLGTFNVYEDISGTDWIQSFPADGHYVVDFTSSLEDTGNDFGNWEPASVEGYKFNDREVDGSFNGDDYGLMDWEIRIEGTTGFDESFNATTSTDADGHWEFTDVPPGTYTITEVMQDDWTQSRGGFTDITFESGEHYGAEGEYDFGNWTTNGIHGYKFEDKNANGSQDTGEGAPQGIGFEITLMGTDFLGNSVLLTTTTDPSTGYYEFTDLAPGTYTVSEALPTDWYQSYPESNFYNVTLESDIAVEMSYDFGNWTPADPHGYKIHDLNADGIDDGPSENEIGLANWEIRIEGTTGWGESYVATTTTSDDPLGYWEFDQVPPGTYTISEVQQDGWSQSYPADDGGYDMTLESGDNPEEDYNFLNWTTATKLGAKFYDANGDGELTDDERVTGLSGWTIYVDYDKDGEFDEGLEPFGVTGEDGLYVINDITPGFYPVREVNDDPDWLNTYPVGGVYWEEFVSDGVYANNDFGNTTKVDKTFELTLEVGAPAETTFMVTFTTEYVGGIDDQIPNDAELADAAVVPSAPESHELELTETEDGSGVYTAVLPVWPQTLITGVEWWAGFQGERIKLGDGVAEELIDAPFTNEFEYGARAFGNKWNDTDLIDPAVSLGVGDGVWDKATEPGIEGWTVKLYRENVSGDGVLYAATTTDKDGAYSFADLLPGEYYVEEEIPLDPDSGEPMWTQSFPAGDGHAAFTVVDETVVGPLDFGNYEPFLPFTPEEEEPEEPVTPAEAPAEPFLPFTGGEAMFLMALMLVAVGGGIAFREAGRRVI